MSEVRGQRELDANCVVHFNAPSVCVHDSQDLNQAHRVGVGFSEGQSLLPFYADSGRKATFTILCQFQADRF
jgi:hypothetical protein